MTEGMKHFKAKLRAMQILKDVLGCESFGIEEPKQGVSFYQNKNWSIDAYGELTVKIAIEVDGKVNHGTKITIAKDKFRDKDNLERNKTYTIRFHPDDLVGKHQLSDLEILSEIRWSLHEQGLLFDMTKKATPTKGPEKWYEGYPNLIWYSLEYGNREIKDFKELDDRRFELDKELQKLVYSKEAVKTLANFIHSFELDNQFDKRLVNELHEVVGKIADKVENRLSVVALDLEFISAACDEWKKRENWEPIVEQSV